MNDRDIRDILASHGPLTGKELRDASRWEELALWRHCHSSPEILATIIGRRYLRLDRNVDGYARLSPSIKREFLTYTVCGVNKDHKALAEKAHSLWLKTREISRTKLDFAREAMTRILSSFPHQDMMEHVLFLIAGDIVYEMAHLEPRPEPSTGRLVRGSDLDIIIIAEDSYPRELLEEFDKAVYQEKYLCLVRQDQREEIDYIIKDISKIRAQLAFDRFEHMVASKILWESQKLLGSSRIFGQVKQMLKDNNIPEKIENMSNKAAGLRKRAEASLLKGEEKMSREESLKLFFTREEADEIF